MRNFKSKANIKSNVKRSESHPEGFVFELKGGPLSANVVRYQSAGIEFNRNAWGQPGKFVKAHKWMIARNEWAKSAADVFVEFVK